MKQIFDIRFFDATKGDSIQEVITLINKQLDKGLFIEDFKLNRNPVGGNWFAIAIIYNDYRDEDGTVSKPTEAPRKNHLEQIEELWGKPTN